MSRNKHSEPDHDDDQGEAPKAAKAPAVELVTMRKDGEELDVHPSCVADHRRLGWVEA